MLDKSIEELESRSLERVRSAQSPEELEAVRVDALGRKGTLVRVSKEMGTQIRKELPCDDDTVTNLETSDALFGRSG